MKTFARWLAKLVGTALVIILVIVFFPHISRIASDLLPDSSSFGVRSAAILSQKLEQANRLETLQVEETGILDHDFLQIWEGNYMANVTVHYQYNASIGIDLSKVQMETSGNEITFTLPACELLADSLIPLETVEDTFWAPHFGEDDFQALLNSERDSRRAFYLSEEKAQERWDAAVKAFEQTVEGWLGAASDDLTFKYVPAESAP